MTPGNEVVFFPTVARSVFGLPTSRGTSFHRGQVAFLKKNSFYLSLKRHIDTEMGIFMPPEC